MKNSQKQDGSPNAGGSRFGDFNLNPALLRSLKEVGYETPTPIQEKIIPHMLEGKDVIGQAETGTGKTAAFALPLLSRIDPKNMQPQVLVLAPTRELSIQVAEAFQRYASHLKNFHILPIYGGQDYNVQLRPLKRGVHVVVGTPGRIMDHMRRKSLELGSLSCLVLDEADEMLRMGFIDDVEWILEQTPDQRQIALFSATMPPAIKKIARRHLRQPVEINLKVKTATAATIRQRYWMVKGQYKLDALTRFLESESFDGILIFVRTKNATVELSEKLAARGFACAPINGDMAQKGRERAVEQLKSGKLDLLVATDVAARGLDVDRISHVINFDIPYDNEAYIHRVGRTGRAGRSGEAILFVSPRETHLLRSIEKAVGQKIELMKMPSIEAVNQKRVEAFKQKITDALASPELETYLPLLRQVEEESRVPPLNIAAALAHQLQGNSPLLLIPGKDPLHDASHEGPDRRSKKNSRFSDKPPRREKKLRDRGAKRGDSGEWQRYRIEVGLSHNVKPGQIVGAIANEAELDSRNIGRIQLFPQYASVELPVGMPKEIFQLLKKTRVAGQRLNLSPWKSGWEEPSKSRPSGKRKRK